MRWLTRLRASLPTILRREAVEARDAIDDLERRLDADLQRRERDLAASPEERLRAQLDEITKSDDDFQVLRERIEGGDTTA